MFYELGIVMHDFSPSTRETERQMDLWVWGRPGLHSEF